MTRAGKVGTATSVQAHDEAVRDAIHEAMTEVAAADPVSAYDEVDVFLDALTTQGYMIIRSDSWRLRDDFDVIPHLKESQIVKGPPSDD